VGLSIRKESNYVASDYWYGLGCSVHDSFGICEEVVMAKEEPTCEDCGHTKRMHSIAGCTYGDKKYHQCMCQVKFTQKDKFR